MESVRIAIVEDDKNMSDTLLGYIENYGVNNGETFEIRRYYTATTFYEAFKGNFDIVFMDIDLPDGNGMEIIKKLREHNRELIVIFVTNMAQFAVKGYEVRAFDFIVKPVNRYDFEFKFKEALEAFRRRADVAVWISNKDGKKRLWASHIKYIEVYKHVLIYHTTEEDYVASGTLSTIEDSLNRYDFASCNRCYLVNLRYVTKVQGLTVTVAGEELQIAHKKRSSFMRELNAYLAGGGNQ